MCFSFGKRASRQDLSGEDAEERAGGLAAKPSYHSFAMPEPMAPPQPAPELDSVKQMLVESVQHRQFPDLFALVIGINKYPNSRGTEAFRSLGYCVKDADAISELLQVKLGVPSENVRNLRDEEATRENIIASIKDLGSDDRIEKDLSSIFIFFAGHGAISTHLESDMKYEVLCPFDINGHPDPANPNASFQPVPGIPDYEIQRLINDVSREKGNNITLFFDCCHSAGINRSSTVASERRIVDPTPLFDKNFPDIRRDGNIVPEAVNRNHQSHVLLAACGKNESAKECPHTKHGWLTAALLRVLDKVPIENLTYETLLSNLEVNCSQCTNDSRTAHRRQNPHCDGFYKERQIFSTTTLKSLILGRKSGAAWTVPCGEITGVLPQSRFKIYETDDSSKPPLGILIATEVGTGNSILGLSPDHPQFLVPDKFFCQQLSRFTNFSVFSSDQPRWDAMFPERELFGIVASDEESADARIIFDGEKVMVYRGHRDSPNHVLGDLLRATVPEKLPGTLHGAAAFYHHLRRVGPTVSTFDDVSIELVFLNKAAKAVESKIELSPDPVLSHIQHATVVVDTPIKEKLWTKPIGMVIKNSSMNDLYPYVFVFNPRTLKIQAWTTLARAIDVPDIPLPHQTTLKIGFDGNYGPWGFFLDPQTESADVAYVKIFLTTTPSPGLDRIVQHPFEVGFLDDWRSAVKYTAKPREAPIMPVLSAWGVKVIEIVQRRQMLEKAP